MRKTDAKTIKKLPASMAAEHGLPLHKPFACLNPGASGRSPFYGVQ